MAIMVIDIGGSAVKYGLWHRKHLSNLGQFPTPATRKEFFQQINQLKTKWQQETTIHGVAVSCPGEIHEDTGMITDLSFVPFLHVLPFLQPMEEAVGLPVSLFNDADSAALAEMTYGIGKGSQHPVFLIIGSGTGFAVIEDGQVLTADHDKINNIRKYLITKFRNMNNINISPVKIAQKVSLSKWSAPSTLSGEEVFQLAEENDPIAQKEIKKMYERLSEVLIAIQHAYQPEFIGIGGGISNNPVFLSTLKKQLQELIKQPTARTDWFVKLFFENDQLSINDLPKLRTCHFKSEANLVGALIHYFQAFDLPLPTTVKIDKK